MWYCHRVWAFALNGTHPERFLEPRAVEQCPDLSDHALVVQVRKGRLEVERLELLRRQGISDGIVHSHLHAMFPRT
jgi:hypothetical protein